MSECGTDNPDAKPDKHVVQCNYVAPTRIARSGARAYVVLTNDGGGHDRISVRVLSRGRRWIEKWEDVRVLGNFRPKTLPPEHPQYANANDYGEIAADVAMRLNEAAERCRLGKE